MSDSDVEVFQMVQVKQEMRALLRCHIIVLWTFMVLRNSIQLKFFKTSCNALINAWWYLTPLCLSMVRHQDIRESIKRHRNLGCHNPVPLRTKLQEVKLRHCTGKISQVFMVRSQLFMGSACITLTFRVGFWFRDPEKWIDGILLLAYDFHFFSIRKL